MGRFVNPDNSAFQVALNSEIYIDKTGLIEYTNRVLNTTQAFICNSRPRRFGKSITADMLTAYYSVGADSKEMFQGLSIASSKDFSTHLNQYQVIHLDIQWCMQAAGKAEKVIDYITKNTIRELRKLYPNCLPPEIHSLPDALSLINADSGKKFIVIIDEWDILIRDEANNQVIQEEYINFLRGMFKGSEPTRFIQLAYLTGIKEVKSLCQNYHKNFEEVKHWYDGYLLAGQQIYNPKAVVSLMTRNIFKSYWSETGTYTAILPLINMNFDGLKNAIIEMLSGAFVPVNVWSFQNDTINFANKDDVLTYLIHLGYLGYDAQKQMAFIPNEEIRQELTSATRQNHWNEL